MMLRRLHRQATTNADEGKLERKTSKRQKIAQFFKSRRRKSGGHDDVSEKIPISSKAISAPTPARVEKPTEAANERANPHGEQSLPAVQPQRTPTPDASPAPEPVAAEKVETLSQGQLDTLFSGAPDFSVNKGPRRPTPSVTYPRDRSDSTKDTTDSIRLDQPAFAAATLHTTSKKSRTSSDERKQYIGFEGDVVELPNMLSQGLEPGSVGFAHFLELPRSDSLLTDLEGSQSSKDFLQGTKNKELMQSSPERIGIRAVNMSLVYDRLVELQDLYETLHDSPGPMTLLNHQSAGELYANLFSKFLTPPGYDGNTNDPTGLRIQILTLMRILKLNGVWYDFSLVEWRIRLGQMIWSDPEPVPEHEPHPLWTEREVLLLQITLACELLLRLDAVSNPDVDSTDKDAQISTQEIRDFFGTKTRKLDWDLVLARRFLDNILTVKGGDDDGSGTAKGRGFLSMLGVGGEVEAPKADIVLLPQHQARQLSGLVMFASTIKWPSTETLMQEMAQKLGARDVAQEVAQLATPDAMFLEPVTPASISVYGTPLQTPRPASKQLDSYFGHIGKPVLSRDNSHSLRIPLSPTLSPQPDQPRSALAGVGGWLSRSYLTGLVLPGEPISHFLISTLLENDGAAIASLGDSANLYGGFTYSSRTWWSKNSIVGRVFACTDGAAECMGWISFPTVPEGLRDMWHSIHSEQLPLDDRLSNAARSALVTQASAIVPDGSFESLQSEDLILPRDLDPAPASCFGLQHWELTPLNADLIDSDTLSGPAIESDVHIPSITFTSQEDASTPTLTLAFDVQFVTSWPCHSPVTIPAPSMPHILKRSLTSTISRTSSKRSGSVRMSRRNSHGFEPLLSHPPDSTDIAPKPMYSIEHENGSDTTITKRKPMQAHPLHKSYKYKTVPVAEVFHPDFVVPFDIHYHKPATRTPTPTHADEHKDDGPLHDKTTILVLDARGPSDHQLLARAWCAEKGYHAIIGRTGRTCLSCCIREARALGIHVVIRV